MARCTRLIVSCLLIAVSINAIFALEADQDPTLDIIKEQDREEADPVYNQESLLCKNPKADTNTVTVLSGNPDHLYSKIHVQCRAGLKLSDGQASVNVTCLPVPDPCMCVAYWQTTTNLMNDLNCTDNFWCQPRLEPEPGHITVLKGEINRLGSMVQIQCPQGKEFADRPTVVNFTCQPLPDPCMCIGIWASSSQLLMDYVNCKDDFKCYPVLEAKKNTHLTVISGGLNVYGSKVRIQCAPGTQLGNGMTDVNVTCHAIPDPCMCAGGWGMVTADGQYIDDLHDTECEQDRSSREQQSNDALYNVKGAKIKDGIDLQAEIANDKNEANRGIQLRDVDGPSPRQQGEEVEAELDTRELTIAKDVEVESNETGEDIVEETEAEETNEEMDVETEQDYPAEEEEKEEIGVETEQESSVDEAEEEVGVETELESPAMEEEEDEEEEEESTRGIQEQSSEDEPRATEQEESEDVEHEEEEEEEEEEENTSSVEEETNETNIEPIVEPPTSQIYNGYKIYHGYQQYIEEENEATEKTEEEQDGDGPEELENKIFTEPEEPDSMLMLEEETEETDADKEFEEYEQTEETEEAQHEDIHGDEEQYIESEEEEEIESSHQQNSLEEEIYEYEEEYTEAEEEEEIEPGHQENDILEESEEFEPEEDIEDPNYGNEGVDFDTLEEYEELTNEIGEPSEDEEFEVPKIFEYQTGHQQLLHRPSMILDAILDPVDTHGEEEEAEMEDTDEDSLADVGDVEAPGWFVDVQLEPVGESPNVVPPPEKGDSCSYKPETGPCKALLLRFYYDPKSNECKKFVYGGCNGNMNNFETLAACHNTCVRDTHS